MIPDYLIPSPAWIRDALLFILQLTSLAFILFAIEHIRPIQRQQSFTSEKRAEIGLAFLNNLLIMPVFQVGILLLFTYTLKAWIPHQILDEAIRVLPLWIQALIGAFLIDLLTYLRHRFTHRYMWRVHAIHHSTEYVNWLTSLRLHPGEVMVDMVFSFVVLYVLGFSGEGMAIAGIIAFCFNIFTHANIDFEWPGFLRYVFGSPNFHRWHHAKHEKDAFDKNFSVVFPAIDLCFRTFYHPPRQLPSEYGLYQRAHEKPMTLTLWGQLSYPFLKRK